MNKLVEPIDFVITWVNTRDVEWRRSFVAHAGDAKALDNFDAKNLEWDTLRFVLRGIESHCPWVRRVHLVTDSQPPAWLNLTHPKLHIVSHTDFIDISDLPTFNSRSIEINLHKIEGLSEDFVYFNDDMLILADLAPEHFFPKGRPAAVAVLNALQRGDSLSHAMLNNIEIINRHFDKKQVLRSNLGGWFSPRYGAKLVRNLLLLAWPQFTGFYEPHLPTAYRKQSFRDVWSAEGEALALTSGSKFRRTDNVNPFLMRYWQICTGDFSPVKPSSYGRFFEFGRDPISEIIESIQNARYPLICVNDGSTNPDYEAHRPLLESALAAALPISSSYEVTASLRTA